MHRLYREILDKRYVDVAPRTKKTIAKFYSTLPAPSRLSKRFIEERLEGLAAGTRRTYMSYIRAIEKATGKNLLEGIQRPRVPKSALEKGDLYTAEELKRIWAAAIETRDRALLMVLYEGALRAEEVLGLNIDDIRPDKSLWWLTVTGKESKTRPVPILHAITELKAWLEVHPTGKGAVFVRFKRPHKRIAYHTMRDRVKVILERAGLGKRKRSIHTFRHTRLTELARMGLTEAEMCAFAGWGMGSAQTHVYVHLSGRDLSRSFGRIYGLKVEEQEPALKMESRVCPRCKKRNPPEARFCSQCSLVLDEELALRMSPEQLPTDQEALGEYIDARIAQLLAERRRQSNEEARE